MPEPLWTSSKQRKESSALYVFAAKTHALHRAAPDDYSALHRWSVDEPESFWSALWDNFDIIGTKGDVAFVQGKSLTGAKFFPDAELNYTENLLRDFGDKSAIIATRDDGTRREISRHQLKRKVARIVHALRSEGIVPGDRVAAIVTNDLEAIEFYLASAAIGAVWASCSPDFGPAGATDRLSQITPKLLIAVPGYGYGDKQIDISETINAVAETSSIKKIIILGDLPKNTAYVKPAIALDEWLAPDDNTQIDYHRAGFDTPMVVLFSSGTTGKPKCIIHRAGGCCYNI